MGGQRDINLFECTIRVVGGLLAAHALSGDALFRDRAALVARAFAETGAFASASGLPYGTMTLVNRSWPVPAPADVASHADDDDGAGAGANASEALVLPPPPAGWPEQLAASMFVGTGVATAGGLAFNPHWFGGASSTSEVATLQAGTKGTGARCAAVSQRAQFVPSPAPPRPTPPPTTPHLASPRSLSSAPSPPRRATLASTRRASAPCGRWRCSGRPTASSPSSWTRPPARSATRR